MNNTMIIKNMMNMNNMYLMNMNNQMEQLKIIQEMMDNMLKDNLQTNPKPESSSQQGGINVVFRASSQGGTRKASSNDSMSII